MHCASQAIKNILQYAQRVLRSRAGTWVVHRCCASRLGQLMTLACAVLCCEDLGASLHDGLTHPPECGGWRVEGALPRHMYK